MILINHIYSILITLSLITKLIGRISLIVTYFHSPVREKLYHATPAHLIELCIFKYLSAVVENHLSYTIFLFLFLY